MKCPSFSRRLPTLVATALLAVAALACSTTQAPSKTSVWKLDNDASDLRFVTTKNTNVAEVQKFKRLAGEVGPDCAVKLVIELASVDTQVPIRNERMQTLLFEVARFPTAEFSAVIDMNPVRGLDVGASVDVELAGKLAVHGQSQDAKASLRVVKLSGNRLLVMTRAPILIDASKYELSPGIEKLREIMALPNIVGTVPVNFALVFQK